MSRLTGSTNHGLGIFADQGEGASLEITSVRSMMKEYAMEFFGVLPLLGTFGLLLTIVQSGSTGEILKSDDGYIYAFAALAFLLPGVLGLLLARNRNWSTLCAAFLFALPLIVLGVLVAYIVLTAELHGPGIAFTIYISMLLVGLCVYFLVPRVLSSPRVQMVLWVPSVLWILGYVSALAYMSRG